MSSLQRNSDHLETLFSFEILLEYIRLIDKERRDSDRQLALGLRMLDFPTLIIYQAEQNGGGNHSNPPQGHLGDENHDKVHDVALPCQREGEYFFNKGKSCLFKMNVDTLHGHLSCTPLFATVLDVKDQLPTLVGTSQISLAKLVDKIKWDVSARGVLSPSSHGEKNVVGLYDLTGEKIGLVSLGYKLVSLGPSLLPHVSATHSRHGSKCTQENSAIKGPPLNNTWLLQSPKLQKSDLCKDKKVTSAMQEDVCVATQTEHKPRSETHQAPQQNEQTLEEDSAVFCPPRLFYNSSVEKTGKNDTKDYKLLKLNAELLSMEDVWSEEDGETESEPQGPKSPLIDQRVTHDAKMRSGQEHQEIGVTPNVLGEALRQLPLLNALLVELSQLNGQTQQLPLNIHPNLAWIYKPSTETSVSRGSPLREDQTRLMSKTRRVARPCLEAIHLPKKVSSTKHVQERQVKYSKMRREDVCHDNKPFHTCNQKKLAYGTTKTFHLRLKQNKATISNANKVIKQKNKVVNQRISLDENVETVMSSVAVDAKQDEEKSKHSYSNMRLLIPISSMDDDEHAAQQRDDNDHQSESGQAQSGSHGSKEKMETPASSRVYSPKSTNSDPSSGGEGVEDYIDDFTSLDPSDGFSPDPGVMCSLDPLSSPEPVFVKTPRSPPGGDLCRSDSTTERIHKKTALPVLVKAPSSPQQSLRGTHIIRPRTLASALSVSSDNDDRDGPAAVPTVHFRTQKANSSRANKASITESFRLSGSQKSAKGFEPRDLEELGDELGSLDLKNNYQHISELVAHKLPGYTM